MPFEVSNVINELIWQHSISPLNCHKLNILASGF